MESVSSWPAIAWEDRAWVPTIPDELVSRRLRERHRGPYRTAIVAPIGDRSVPLPDAVVALAEEATIEIARFDAEIGARLAPFGAILLRSESASSSRIENLTAAAKTIALAELGSTGQSNAVEIVANVHTMQAAIALGDGINDRLIMRMHAALMREHAGAGQWRTQQVWIGGDNIGPHGAHFVPPHHERVPAAMADLISFVARQDVPILAQAAVAHAQFETIHPFTDGNGRTGRALIHSMLRAKELTRKVTVPIAAGLLTDVTSYVQALTAYESGDPAPVVERFAEASFAAITNARHLVADITEIRDRWSEVVSARPQATCWRVADLAMRLPVFDIAALSRELHVSPSNALRALDPLVQAEVLSEFTGRKRNRMWQAREILSALDYFAVRAQRRTPC